MFGIGQFAQVAKVSVRALRHYDEVGLLRPAAVDSQTGYRSYDAAQLPLLNRILVLKDLGFTLAEITRMLEAGVTNEELVGMLRLRRAEAERQANDEQRRLARVAARIDILTGEPDMTDVETAVVVKPIDAVVVAVVGESASGFDEDFAPIFGRLYPALFEELQRCGVDPAGPTYGLYDQRDDGDIDVMAAVVVSSDAALESSTVTIRHLEAGARAATLVHQGDMEGVVNSYAILDRWMTQTGESPVGFSREVYLNCPPDDRDAWVTELQFLLD